MPKRYLLKLTVLPSLKDKGKKTLELKKIGNEWKIYKEIM